METTASAATALNTASPAPVAPVAPQAPAKVKFESFQKLEDSPGNVVTEPPKPEAEVEAAPEPQQAETDEKPKPPVAKPEKKEPAAKYKVKVDGQEEELDLEQIIAGYQRAASSTRRAQEAAAERKQAADLKAQLEAAVQDLQRRSPEEILRALGRSDQDINAFAEDQLRRQLELAKLSPKDREIAELRQALDQRAAQEGELRKAMEDSQRAEQNRQAEAHHAAELAKYTQEIDQQLPVAMEKHGLPKTPFAAAFVARLMAEQLDAGNSSFSLDDAAALAREEIGQWIKTHLKDDLPVDYLRAIIPEATLKKLRVANVQQLTQPAVAQTTKQASAKRQQGKQEITSFAKLYEDDFYTEGAPDPITSSLVR